MIILVILSVPRISFETFEPPNRDPEDRSMNQVSNEQFIYAMNNR
jgi:hypothetical protein